MIAPPEVLEIARRFRVLGRPVDAKRQPGGHIHDSFKLKSATTGVERHYLLQRVNTRVFPDPRALMRNCQRVLQHLGERAAGASPRRPSQASLTLIPTQEGEPMHTDPLGGVWRMFNFLEHARTRAAAEHPHQAREAAAAFGRFSVGLVDLPAEQIVATIPDFHHTPRRLDALRRTVREDPVGRAPQVRAELDFIEAHAPLAGSVQSLLDVGAIPLRLAHNDAKIANVLFDERTDEAIGVIDLDTVMPGSPLHDFADLMRSMICRRREDEGGAEPARIEPEYFEALASGFLAEAGAMLNPAEREHLVLAGAVITFEQSVRFLNDDILGDVYYRIERPRQNLDRARAQMALLKAILQERGPLERIVRSCFE